MMSKNTDIYYVPSAERRYLNHLRLWGPQWELNPKLCQHCGFYPACTCATEEINEQDGIPPRISGASFAESLMLPSASPAAYCIIQRSIQGHIHPIQSNRLISCQSCHTDIDLWANYQHSSSYTVINHALLHTCTHTQRRPLWKGCAISDGWI